MKQKPYKTKDVKLTQAKEPISVFESRTIEQKVPVGYKTPDQFKESLLGRLDKFYKENGLS